MGNTSQHEPEDGARNIVTNHGLGSTGPVSRAGSSRSAPLPAAHTGATDAETGVFGGFRGLVSGVVGDIQGLLHDELQRTNSELKEEATTAASGAATVAAGGIAGLAGAIFLMLGVADLLSRRMPRWAANSIVGLVLLGTAGRLGLSGKQKLSTSNLNPAQTVHSLRHTAAWAKTTLRSTRPS